MQPNRGCIMTNQAYVDFINEQKDYFEQHLGSGFNQTWNDEYWQGGEKGSGWLHCRSKDVNLVFNEGKRLKGLPAFDISENFYDFFRSILVLSYRKSNSKASPQKLHAELLVLKRWYYSLVTLTSCNSPQSMCTEALVDAFKIQVRNSNPQNLPDIAGTYVRLQKLINKHMNLSNKLEFENDYNYLSKVNRTPNARKTKELIDKLDIDEDEVNTKKLISIQTFINIASLKGLCQTNGEKLLLNFLTILIITGFRSTEAILLKKNCLVKKPLLDPSTRSAVKHNGIEQYSLGIRYYGAKGAGEKIHWVEPSSSALIERLVLSTIDLTEESRNTLRYLRSKNLIDFLPKAIDDIKSDLIELDDLMNILFHLKESKLGRAGKRDMALSSFKSAGVIPDKKLPSGKSILRFYSRNTINDFIKSLTNYDKPNPIDYIFNYSGTQEIIPFEELLFIHEYRSTNLKRDFYNKTNVIPLTNILVNGFLGATRNISVFEKFNLKDKSNKYSQITSHIPRHNINTFLAIAEVSEHLQAMLMGRTNPVQNQSYQHLSLRQKSFKADLSSKKAASKVYSVSSSENNALINQEPHIKTPIDNLLEDLSLYTSPDQSLENNIRSNLHTFDNKDEIAEFFKPSSSDVLFNDFIEGLDQAYQNQLINSEVLADELIKRHAYLYPLPFGSCTRNIGSNGCPKRLACQTGSPCSDFTITGRLGELSNLIEVKKSLMEQYEFIGNSSSNLHSKEILKKTKTQLENLQIIEDRMIERQQGLTKVSIYEDDKGVKRLPKTVSELFTIEYDKSKNKEEL